MQIRNYTKHIITFFIICLCIIRIEAQQLRGTWLARNSFSTKAALAAAMDSLANNNFNVVYVNAWSRGYPLWISNVFHSHTGIYIDPTYNGRDILAEAIAEGHRNGLQVEAWFEYGFVGGWTGNMPAGQKGPIFNAHPTWVAKQKNGTEIDGSNFYWMIHTLPDAQNFLIALAAEIARNYDVDGIELDRIRYSSLEYGYDSVTVNLYKSEHGGASPPATTNDAAWIRWRSDKLNNFVARIYDSLKTINPYLNISNAPSHYSSTAYSAYNNFCQDWIWWVDNNKVDNVNLQMYVNSPATFGSYLNYVNANVINKSKVFPSFAIKPGGTSISNNDLLSFFQVTTQKGFQGNAIWYYEDLIPRFSFIKSNVYNAKTFLPYAPSDWRNYYSVDLLSNTIDVIRNGNWINSSLPGFSGNSIYTTYSPSASIDYFFSVPKSAYYEVYAFNVVSTNRTANAQYIVSHTTGAQNILVDQSDVNKSRWIKLGDFYFTSGRKKIVQLTNANLPSDKFLSGDAFFISLNRRLSPVELNTNLQITCIPQGFYDNSSQRLNMKDTAHAYLANVFTPYSIVDSAKSVIDSLSFTGNFLFKEAPTGNFFILLKHRNSIETWSRIGGESIVKGISYIYNFTTDSAKAFGNNLIKKGNKWCIYSGDVNQDGVINSKDLTLIYNDTFSFSIGYRVTDLTGDNFIDLTDLMVYDNNASNNIIVITPLIESIVMSQVLDKVIEE